jgi:hypothetical protein
MSEHMLTTVDNPFDPFKDFDEWNSFDTAAGYHTMAYLARIVKSSHELSDTDQSLAIELAIDEIVSENILGIYRKVAAPGSDSSMVEDSSTI